MDTEAARRFTSAEQHERRRQVIRAYKRGLNKRRISRDVGLSYSATCKIMDCYEAGGMQALAPRKRGRRVGDKRVLRPPQEARIQQLICDQRPEQLKMELALWSRIAVRQLILDEYDIDVPVRTVGTYLKRWGFTPQKPIKRAYEQSPAAVQAWLEQDTPLYYQKAPRRRKPRFNGVMKRPWSTPMSAAAAMPPEDKHLWHERSAAPGKSCR